MMSALFGVDCGNLSYAELNYSPEILLELRDTNIIRDRSIEGQSDKKNDLYGRVEFTGALSLSEQWQISHGIIAEPVQDRVGGRNRHFDDHGVYLEELFITYAHEGLEIGGGKFNPDFGRAWETGMGIWSEEYASDYELTEKTGLFMRVTLPEQSWGTLTLNSHLFQDDATPLSRSTITQRGRNHRDQGGAGNTSDLSSYSITADVENIFGLARLNLHAGFRRLNDVAGPDDALGRVIAISHQFSGGTQWTHHLLAEIAVLDRFEDDQRQRRYHSLRIDNIYDHRWRVTLSTTDRRIAASDQDRLYQLSFGYVFPNQASVEFGTRIRRGTYHDDSLGLLIRYPITITH